MRAAYVGFALLLATAPAHARVWTDDTGGYTLEAELIAFDAHHAVLQRASDGELGLIDLERLSEEDRRLIEARRSAAESGESDLSLWRLRSGLEFTGRVVDFARREVTYKRKRGKVYVNDRVLENLPAVYRKIAPQIVAEQAGAPVDDAKSLESWLVKQKGGPVSFTVDGVVMEIDNGDEYALPFFLFAERDQRVLTPGWQEWLAAQGEQSTDRRSELSLALEARAAQRDAFEQEQLRIARLQFGMAAVNAGVTSLWEVTLYPAPGVNAAPIWVVVPGRDSRVASQTALQRNPGYTLGPVRRVSR